MSRGQLPWPNWIAASTLGTEFRFRLVVHHPDTAWRAAWDSEVQPEIDRVGFGADEQREAFRRMRFFSAMPLDVPAVREDTAWRWSAAFPLGEIARAEVLGAAAGLQPTLFALSIVHPVSHRLVPAAMLLLCEGFEPAPQLLSGRCVFVWYLSIAPDSTLNLLLGAARSFAQLRPLAVDVAISRSFHLGYRGRLVLHAPQLGGNPLLQSYEDLGLTEVPDSAPHVSVGRPNDGRYFLADEATAERLSIRQDPFRKPFETPAAEPMSRARGARSARGLPHHPPPLNPAVFPVPQPEVEEEDFDDPAD